MNKGLSPEAHNPSTKAAVDGSGIKSLSPHSQLYTSLNDELGTNYGYLSRAGLDNALKQKQSASLSKLGIDARIKYSPGRRDVGIVGKGASMMSSYTPPALVSQPFSSNFQFQFFLPPQYQQFSKGNDDLDI